MIFLWFKEKSLILHAHLKNQSENEKRYSPERLQAGRF